MSSKVGSPPSESGDTEVVCVVSWDVVWYRCTLAVIDVLTWTWSESVWVEVESVVGVPFVVCTYVCVVSESVRVYGYDGVCGWVEVSTESVVMIVLMIGVMDFVGVCRLVCCGCVGVCGTCVAVSYVVWDFCGDRAFGGMGVDVLLGSWRLCFLVVGW